MFEPYARALARCVGSALVAAVIVGGLDAGLTLAGAEGVAGADVSVFVAVTLALYAALALVAGALEGILFGAIAATHGPGWLRRFWRALGDADTDRRVAAGILAGVCAAGVYAGLIALLAIRFVAIPQRKAVGALLLGGAAAALVPVFVVLAYPAYRVFRKGASYLPRLGSIPTTVFVLVVVLGGAMGAGLFYVMTRLDWRALPVVPGGFLLLFLVIQGLCASLPFDKRRVLVVIGAAAAALAAALIIPRARPSDRAVALLTVEGRGVKLLASLARALADRDGDGYSTILGGGDCDDSNPAIHPGAFDIPDNGIDENCSGEDAHREEEPSRATPVAPSGKLSFSGNVLLIAVDTVRADRLGVAGYRRKGRSLTPRIDALADQGARFTRVYAQAPNTPRSFPSLFLSRYPSHIKWEADLHPYAPVAAENLSLFEVLAAGGYHTVGISSHFYFVPTRGITQGFDEYDNEGALNIRDSNHDIASPRIVPRVEAKLVELARAKTRFALFVHLFEPHSTYMEHPEFPIEGKGLAGLEEKYDYEIAYVDGWVGKILDALQANGLDKNTLVVLFSDHGEAFGAHKLGGERMFFHGQTLYDELLQVPLIVAGPGIAPRKVDGMAELVDIAPTVVDAVGLATPREFEGRSLVPALVGETLPPRPAFAELLPAPSWNHQHKAMISPDGKTKLIYRVSDNFYELYDLAADPTEQTNLAGSRPELLRPMKAALTRWMESAL